jgi:phage shock protein PspC (stress-responsive transcriptional regulator)
MKKTISINIAGIIFHIEDDGYEKLKAYLSSIQRYFSSFADSKEILSDIEGRIAERFLSKQKSENKQVISIEDVEELVAAMGTVADFEAIEQAEDILSDPLAVAADTEFAEPFPQKAPFEPHTQHTQQEPKSGNAWNAFQKKPGQKFVRDLKRKLLGGVASGLAYNYSVDPLWVRIAFLLCFFSMPLGASIFHTATFGFLSGLSLVIYIAMWIAFPGSANLEEDTKIKKFYRNPDQKVVGGVAAGVASYFGADVGVIRFLWVISIFLFGTGVMAYIVLWIIAPAANTITEKMEMQGEPITLSNIESNIKQGLQLDQNGDNEHIITKISLLPFRGIAIIVNVIGKLLKGVGPILRVLTGTFLVFFGALSLLALIIGIAALLGFSNTVDLNELPMPFRMIQELPDSLLLSGVIVSAVPFIAFLLLGFTLLTNRKIVGVSVWLTLLGLWIVGIVVSTMQGISYQQNFAKRGSYAESVSYVMPQKIFVLDRIVDHDNDSSTDTYINLAGYNGKDSLRLDKMMYSKGRTKNIANNLASELKYDLTVKDSIFLFSDGPTSEKNGPFRDQRIDLTFNIPFDKTFIMTQSFWSHLSRWNGNLKQLDKYELEGDHVNWQSLRWAIRPDSGLVCINLPAEFRREENQSSETDSYRDEMNDDDVNLGERGTYIKQFSINEFNKIDLGGAYAVLIRKGDEYSISADGAEEIIDNLKVTSTGGVLQVSHPSESDLSTISKGKRVGLIITTPRIDQILFSGANKAIVSGFENQDHLSIDVTGASKVKVNVNQIKHFEIDLSGAAKAFLQGSVHALDAKLSGVCKLNGKGMNIERANVDASGASKAYFNNIKNMKKFTSGVSKVEME